MFGLGSNSSPSAYLGTSRGQLRHIQTLPAPQQRQQGPFLWQAQQPQTQQHFQSQQQQPPPHIQARQRQLWVDDAHRQYGPIEDVFEDIGVIDYTPTRTQDAAASAAQHDPAGSHAEGNGSSPGGQSQHQQIARDVSAAQPSTDAGNGSDDNGGWSDDGSNGASLTSQEDEPASPATEFILSLERRGEGWGEEIFPRISAENRPIEKPRRERPRSSQPEPWEDGSLEIYLSMLGLEKEQVDQTVEMATQWRVTDGGRPLLDRRRRSRVERNVHGIRIQLMQENAFTKEEVGELLMKHPQVLLCKTSHNDRFDRRVVSLAAFRFRNGHLNITQECPEAAELVPWMQRMRVARAQGTMIEERQQILEALGFEFGEVAQITDDWECHFDQLLDWLQWLDDEDPGRGPPGWCGADWGERGGRTARELALWCQLQRELMERGLIQPMAQQRLNAIGLAWKPEDGRPDDRKWMKQLGKLIFAVERTRRTSPAKCAVLAAAMANQDPPTFEELLMGRPPLAPLQQKDLFSKARKQAILERGGPRKVGRPTYVRSGGAGAMTAAEVVLERRAALSLASLEPGVGYWLAKQRLLWRTYRLPKERLEMLELAGVDMDYQMPDQWLHSAQCVARHVTGGACPADAPPAWPSARPAQLPDLYGNVPPPPRPGRRLRLPLPLPMRAREPAMQTAGGAATAIAAAAAAPVAAAAATPPAASGNSGSRRGRQKAASKEEPPEPLKPLSRVAMRRWVLTQKRLVGKGLSPAQFRYLMMLGITWLLSDEVVAPRPSVWAAIFEQVAATSRQARASAASRPTPRLREWLAHQKGLFSLGLLSMQQVALLERLGVQWGVALTASEQRWATCFAHLVAFARRHGHCQVPQDVGVLAEWLAHQMVLWRTGQLPQMRQAQLKALGAQPDVPPPAPKPRPRQQ